MSNLWVDIEALVLDGVPLNPIDGRRLAQLTEVALTRLLQQHGSLFESSLQENQESHSKQKPVAMRSLTGSNEARWAEELAMVLYRAMDRTL